MLPVHGLAKQHAWTVIMSTSTPVWCASLTRNTTNPGRSCCTTPQLRCCAITASCESTPPAPRGGQRFSSRPAADWWSTRSTTPSPICSVPPESIPPPASRIRGSVICVIPSQCALFWSAIAVAPTSKRSCRCYRLGWAIFRHEGGPPLLIGAGGRHESTGRRVRGRVDFWWWRRGAIRSDRARSANCVEGGGSRRFASAGRIGLFRARGWCRRGREDLPGSLLRLQR